MKLTDKKCLLTGAEGFIGSHLAQELVRKGASVRALVHYNPSNSWGCLDYLDEETRDAIEIIQGDVRYPDSVRRAVEGCNAVFHLAALIGIPYSYQSPEAYIDTNVKGTLNVLQAVRDFSVEKMVHTSTSEVYGSAQFVPISEQHPVVGQSPYAASKIGADQLAQSFFCSFNTPVTIVRPFNTYGPRQSVRAIIPSIISQIASGSALLKLGSLHPTRDFSYVIDTVRGFVKAAESEKSPGETINIGSNFEISIKDTVDLIVEVMNARVTIETEETRVRPTGSEVTRLWADNTKAKELLGWEPLYAGKEGMTCGIKETVAWFSDKSNHPNYKAHLYNV